MNCKFILSTLALIFCYSAAYACSCFPAGELNILDFNQANLVFVGKAEKVVIDEVNFQRIVTFKITQRLKSPRKGKRVEVWTALHSATCGLTINESTEWYIWASKADDGIYRSNICTRSMRLIEELVNGSEETRYHKDMAFMEQLKKHRGITTITYKNGKGVGKLRRGCPVGEWMYYDENGKLSLTCQYTRRGRENTCKEPGPATNDF